MHDDMQYDLIQGQDHEPLKVLKFGHFQRLSPSPFITGAGKWPSILKLGAVSKACHGRIFYFCPNFCVM